MGRWYRLTLVALALVASRADLSAQVDLQDPVWTSRLDSLAQALPSWMTEAGIPGLSLAVVTSREAWYHDFGLISAETEEAIGPETLFEAASLSKPVFAHIVLDEVAGGLLGLDAPLEEYWDYPDLRLDPQRGGITARIVLSHRTGLPNWRRDGPLRIQFEPGSRFQYSGEGYVYLQRVLAALTGTSLENLAREKLLAPLGLDRSGFTFRGVEPDHALPHDSRGHPLAKRPAEPPGNAAASLHTTARDYGEFVSATLRMAKSAPDRFEGVTERLADVADGVGWGLGWGLEYPNERGSPALWHWGDNGPFKAFVYADPVSDVGFVFFANSMNGLAITQRVLEHLFPGAHPLLDWLEYDQLR
jgi:CubicO group peptidase (beta-lactamase class C family)